MYIGQQKKNPKFLKSKPRRFITSRMGHIYSHQQQYNHWVRTSAAAAEAYTDDHSDRRRRNSN